MITRLTVQKKQKNIKIEARMKCAVGGISKEEDRTTATNIYKNI